MKEEKFLLEEIDNALDVMMKYGLKQFFILQFTRLFADKAPRWWVIVIHLNSDYYVSVYEIKQVEMCPRDSVCFKTVAGTFRMISIGHQQMIPLDEFKECLMNRDGTCLY